MDRRPAQQTIVTAQQVLEAMAQAYADFFHAPTDKTALLILLAQSAFETGWWRFMWNNNLGNYKAVENGVYDWTYFTCNEYIADAHIPAAWRTDPRITIVARDSSDLMNVVIRPDHPACCFASFPNLASGAQEYLSRLVRVYSDPSDQGPKDAWHWAVQGDVPRFVAALRSHGYFTDDVDHYTSLVLSCKKRLEGMGLNFDTLPSWPAPADPDQPVIHAFPEPDALPEEET